MSTIAAARPLVSVRKIDSATEVAGQVALPSVFLAPIRPDIVHFVHSNMNKNKRQAYAVSEGAGHQHSAESWGTGRAVARVPRVSGGGTSRSGQGAFANQCRKGRMFAPTKIWRKWHRKINTNQKRFAVASALAASALPSLVLARGHKIENVPEIPLVLDNSVESLTKTKQAVLALRTIGALADVEKVKDSKKLRAGKGKMRNRRYVQRRGPLVVYSEDNGVVRAFRNLPGVELSHVDSLNLLQLAPGGHLGRFVIWTRGAFDKLNANWGSVNRESTQKKGYFLPRPMVTNSDITRVINSDEIQSKVRAARVVPRLPKQKKNPLKNFGAMVKLNPYAVAARRFELLTEQRRASEKASGITARRIKKANAIAKKHEPTQKQNYKRLVADELFPMAKAPVVNESVVIPAVHTIAKKIRKEKAALEEAVVEVVAPVAAKDAKKPAAPAKDAKAAAPAKDAKAAPAKAAPKK